MPAHQVASELAVEAASKRTALLDGRVIDRHGTPMHAMRGNRSGVAGGRYYISEVPAFREREMISVARLDRGVVAILQRIGLLAKEWQPAEVAAVVRRVVVYTDNLVLQLDKRMCLAAWRAEDKVLRRVAASEVLRLMNAHLVSGEELFEVGLVVCLRTPKVARTRRRAKAAAPSPAPES